MPMRACNSPCMHWRRGRRRGNTPTGSSSITSKTTRLCALHGPTRSWKGPSCVCKKWQTELLAGSLLRIPSITARSVRIAIFVRLRRRSWRRRGRNRRLGFISFIRISRRSLGASVIEGRNLHHRGHRGHRGGTEVQNQFDVRKSGAKNFGDAHRVPFVVACCGWLVLFAAFLLCFLFGCHGSILPFHCSWNFATVLCCN